MSLAVKLGGTQNKAWAESIEYTSRFGYKLLEKMGWAEGKGLGKNNSGQLTHVQVKKKGDTLGLGVDDSNLANKHFLSAATSYNEILKKLNKQHSEERKLVEDSKSKKRKLSIDGEEEKRVYKLHKLLKNKNVKNYSKEDLTIITGTPRDGDDELKDSEINTNTDSITVNEEIKVDNSEKDKEMEIDSGEKKKKKKDKMKKKEEKKEEKEDKKHKKHKHHKNKE